MAPLSTLLAWLDEDDFLDPPLFELGIQIGVGEAALRPVLKHEDVAMAGAEFGMELSAPTSGSEALGLVRPNLGIFIRFHP
jgi:hypothetical protein